MKTKVLQKFNQIKKIKRKFKIKETIARPQIQKKILILIMLIAKTYLMMTTISKYQKNPKFQKPYQLKPLELWLF